MMIYFISNWLIDDLCHNDLTKLRYNIIITYIDGTKIYNIMLLHNMI